MKLTKSDWARLKAGNTILESRHGRVELREILEPYDLGESINSLSFQLKLTEPRIRKILVENGREIRNKKQAATANYSAA